MNLFLWMLLAVIAWIAAVFVFMHMTQEKLGARSALLGIGMANVTIGFIWHEILEKKIMEGMHGIWDVPKITGTLSFLFLVLAVAGILMIGMDILKAVHGQD